MVLWLIEKLLAFITYESKKAEIKQADREIVLLEMAAQAGENSNRASKINKTVGDLLK
jgi:hypothetical protein